MAAQWGTPRKVNASYFSSVAPAGYGTKTLRGNKLVYWFTHMNSKIPSASIQDVEGRQTCTSRTAALTYNTLKSYTSDFLSSSPTQLTCVWFFFLKPSLTCDAKVEVLPKWGHNVSLTVCRCLMTKYFDEGNKDKAKEEYCLPDCLTNLFNHTKQNMRQMMSMDEILNLCGSSDDK